MANVLMKMAGHRKATQRYCNDCQTFHNTRRAVGGVQECLLSGIRTLEYNQDDYNRDLGITK